MRTNKVFRLAAGGLASLLLLAAVSACAPQEVTKESWEYEDDVSSAAGTSSADSGGSGQSGGAQSQAGSKQTGASSVSSRPSALDTSGGTDLKGATIKISKWGLGLKPDSSTIYYKQYSQLVSAIEKKYKCKLDFPVIADSLAYGRRVTTDAASGQAFADIIFMPGDQAFPQLAVKGYFRELDGMVNLKDPKWNQVVTNEIMPISGKHYFLAPATEAYSLTIGGIFFNKQVFSKLGISKTPYDYVNENNWTWETFRELAKQLTKKANNVQYYGYSDLYVAGAILSNGGFPTKMVNGRCVYNLDDEKSIEAIEFFNSLYNTDKVIGTPKLWLSGLVGMSYGAAYQGDDFNDALGEENVGYVYHPRGPKTKDYNVVGTNINVVGIPKATKKDAKILAKILEDFSDLYSWRPTVKDSMERYFSDSTALDIMMNQSDRAYRNINLLPAYPYLTKTVLWGDLGIKSQKSAQAFVKEVKNAAQDDIDAMWGYKK